MLSMSLGFLSAGHDRTDQCSRCTVFYFNHHVIALSGVALREYDYLVLIVPAEIMVGRAFGNAFYEYFTGSAYFFPHAFERVPAVKGHDFGEPAFFDVFRYIVLVTARSQRAGPFGVGEH